MPPKAWTSDRGLSERPRPRTVIGAAERLSRGMPRLPTMADARSSYTAKVNSDAMCMKRAMYFQQRCPYDTVPKRVPEVLQRGGMGAGLQHSLAESSSDTLPVSIPVSRMPSRDSLTSGNMSQESLMSSNRSEGQPATRSLAYPSADWTVRMDRSGRQYYVNKVDKRITWTFPKPDNEDVRPNADGDHNRVNDLEDRVLQRFSSDMLAVREGPKKEFGDPFSDALLNKRVRREERGIMLESAAGDSTMALVEGGRDSQLSGASPTGTQGYIHQSISRGFSTARRVPRNLSKANIVSPSNSIADLRALGTFSQLKNGSRSSSTIRSNEQRGSDIQMAVFDGGPNMIERGDSTHDAQGEKVGLQSQASKSSISSSRNGKEWTRVKHNPSTFETLEGLPTFQAEHYKTLPLQQTLSPINSKAIILNYAPVDWEKSAKGVLAPIIEPARLPNPHFANRFLGDENSGEWSRPVSSLTPKGIVYPDGTIGPSNPVEPVFDQASFENEQFLRDTAERKSSPTEWNSHAAEGYKQKFRDWVLQKAGQLKQKPQHALMTTQLSLPVLPMGFKDQLRVIRELMEEKEIGEHLYRLFRETILTYDDAHVRRQKSAASREQQRQAPPPRSKGGLWPDGGGTTLRDASSTDTKPYADIGCDEPADQYTTTLKTFNSTVSGHEPDSIRDARPAGRTSPGGHSGGEAYGNVSESVTNVEEALTRSSRRPVTSVYMPKRISEISVCHYGAFNTTEKFKEVQLYDPNNLEKLTVSPKVPKVLGVDSVFYDSTRYREAKHMKKTTESSDHHGSTGVFAKSNWLTFTSQRSRMPRNDVRSQYVRTPGANQHY